MSEYIIKPTAIGSFPIRIEENTSDESTSLVLYGRRKLKYGAELNENLLNLMENFCVSGVTDGDFFKPDETEVIEKDTNSISGEDVSILSRPVNGQTWFNTSRKTLNFFNSNDLSVHTGWSEILSLGQIAGNMGFINSGETLPLPTMTVNGVVHNFTIDECVWIVSPVFFTEQVSGISCSSDENGLITSTFTNSSGAVVSTIASYVILGIKDNQNAINSTTEFYSITAPSYVNEGDSVTVTLETMNVADGDVSYVITGVGVLDVDIPLSGVISVIGGVGTLTINVSADLTTEGHETMLISVADGQASKSIVIYDTSIETSTPPTSGCVVSAPASAVAGEVFSVSFSSPDVGTFPLSYYPDMSGPSSVTINTPSTPVVLSLTAPNFVTSNTNYTIFMHGSCVCGTSGVIEVSPVVETPPCLKIRTDKTTYQKDEIVNVNVTSQCIGSVTITPSAPLVGFSSNTLNFTALGQTKSFSFTAGSVGSFTLTSSSNCCSATLSSNTFVVSTATTPIMYINGDNTSSSGGLVSISFTGTPGTYSISAADSDGSVLSLSGLPVSVLIPFGASEKESALRTVTINNITMPTVLSVKSVYICCANETFTIQVSP